MTSPDFVTVQSFDHRIHADMLLLLLRQRDIPARLADEHTVALQWDLANAIGGIKVQVPIIFESQAREIASRLKTPSSLPEDQPSPTDDVNFCLSCGTAMPGDQSVCTHCGWTYNG
jgi:hypothetical protein